MLRRVLCFIDAKPPSTKMSNFFPLTKQISVNLGGDPSAFVSARLPFDTPESAISHIQQLQDYTVLETTEVVIFSSLFYDNVNFGAQGVSAPNFASIIVFRW